MPIKTNLIKTEKDKSLSKLNYRKKDIWWFFQWLKVTVDLQGKNLEFNKSKADGGRYGVAKDKI